MQHAPDFTWTEKYEEAMSDEHTPLAKWSSFRKSSFALTQANYRNIQRTAQRKSKQTIHFLLPLLVSQENEMLVLWLAVDYTLTEITEAVVHRCSSK